MVHRTAKGLSDIIHAKHEKTVKLKIKTIQLLKNPESSSNHLIGFVPDHLELGCSNGVSLYRLTEFPYQSVIAVRVSEDEVSQVVHPYVDTVYVGKAKNYFHDNDKNNAIAVSVFQTNKTFSAYSEKLNNRKPFRYALSKDGQVHQLDAKIEKITASVSVLEKSCMITSGYVVVNELFYDRSWHTVLMVVANFFTEAESNRSKSIIKMFDITTAADPLTSPAKVFSNEKQIQLNPMLNQLIKPVMIRLPKAGFGFAIGGLCPETGKANVHLVFLEGTQSIIVPLLDKNLFYLIASDVKQSNWSSILSIAADNLYQIDLEAKPQTLKKIADLNCALPPYLVQSPLGGEFNIIAVGTLNAAREISVLAKITKGIFRIQPNGQVKLLGTLEPNHYQALICRWGFMRLLPKQSGAMMKELDLSYDELRSLSPDEKWGDEKKYGQVSFCKLNE